MSGDAIATYLTELERELRLKRVPHRRLLAETADHLRSSAQDLEAGGVAPGEAERLAVERFGAAALVARRFAHVVASTSARRALVWTATAFASYVVTAAFFVLTGPSWLRDFPQGAPSMLALQVAAVALTLTGLRALHARKAGAIDETRLPLVANGVVVAAAVVAVAAAAELLLALTRPVPAPWGDVAGVIAIYGVASAAALGATFFAVAAAARVSSLAAPPVPSGGVVSRQAASLVDDVAAVAPPLMPLAAAVDSRPNVACAVAAILAFAGLALLDLEGADSIDASILAGAAATGLFEASAVVVAYLALGRVLGLRPSRLPTRGASGPHA
jgi:hypothetical protein